jgi:hypothetical protein
LLHRHGRLSRRLGVLGRLSALRGAEPFQTLQTLIGHATGLLLLLLRFQLLSGFLDLQIAKLLRLLRFLFAALAILDAGGSLIGLPGHAADVA